MKATGKNLHFTNLRWFVSVIRNIDLSLLIWIVSTERVARLISSWSEMLSHSNNCAGRSRAGRKLINTGIFSGPGCMRIKARQRYPSRTKREKRGMGTGGNWSEVSWPRERWWEREWKNQLCFLRALRIGRQSAPDKFITRKREGETGRERVFCWFFQYVPSFCSLL